MRPTGDSPSSLSLFSPTRHDIIAEGKEKVSKGKMRKTRGAVWGKRNASRGQGGGERCISSILQRAVMGGTSDLNILQFMGLCSCPTVVEESLHVQEDIWERGELLLVLEQLGQVVGDALGVVAHVVVVVAAVAVVLLVVVAPAAVAVLLLLLLLLFHAAHVFSAANVMEPAVVATDKQTALGPSDQELDGLHFSEPADVMC